MFLSYKNYSVQELIFYIAKWFYYCGKMVDEQIIIDTIKRMLDADIDDSTIISTLKDIGMTEEQARKQVEDVKNESDSSDDDEDIESQLDQGDQINSMRGELESQSQKSELNEVTTHNKLDLHEQKIDDVGSKIDDVKKTMVETNKAISDSSHLNKMSGMNDQITSIESQVRALTKLMKDVLEVNRKILTELEMKK